MARTKLSPREPIKLPVLLLFKGKSKTLMYGCFATKDMPKEYWESV
jgi:hypothetical protein